MSVKTKIIVIRKRELLLIGLAAALVLGLILLFSGIFASGREASLPTDTNTAQYVPGVYTTTVVLNDTAMDVEVAVDANHINSVRLVNLDETVETMYPLVKPAMEELSSQILASQSADAVTYSPGSQYTSMVLHNAIKAALAKGSLSQSQTSASSTSK